MRALTCAGEGFGTELEQLAGDDELWGMCEGWSGVPGDQAQRGAADPEWTGVSLMNIYSLG